MTAMGREEVTFGAATMRLFKPKSAAPPRPRARGSPQHRQSMYGYVMQYTVLVCEHGQGLYVCTCVCSLYVWGLLLLQLKHQTKLLLDSLSLPLSLVTATCHCQGSWLEGVSSTVGRQQGGCHCLLSWVHSFTRGGTLSLPSLSCAGQCVVMRTCRHFSL